jgi:hypothetical protein
MKDVYDVLTQKEEDIARVRHEIECLKIAAVILEKSDASDEADTPDLVDDQPAASRSRSEGGIVNTLANALTRRYRPESA